MRARHGILISVAASVVTTLAVLAFLFGVGAVVAQKGGPVSEPLAVPGQPQALQAGPAADESPEAEFGYYHVPGLNLYPRDSRTTVAYDALGCVHVTASPGASPVLGADMHLPDGATIKYLRLYFNDTSSSGYIDAFMTLYDGGLAFTDTISLRNNFNLGWGYAVSSEATHTVTNSHYAYSLLAIPSEYSSQLQICGLRIAYLPVPFDHVRLLPMQLRNSQP